jgi:hypothetical protein
MRGVRWADCSKGRGGLVETGRSGRVHGSSCPVVPWVGVYQGHLCSALQALSPPLLGPVAAGCSGRCSGYAPTQPCAVTASQSHTWRLADRRAPSQLGQASQGPACLCCARTALPSSPALPSHACGGAGQPSDAALP